MDFESVVGGYGLRTAMLNWCQNLPIRKPSSLRVLLLFFDSPTPRISKPVARALRLSSVKDETCLPCTTQSSSPPSTLQAKTPPERSPPNTFLKTSATCDGLRKNRVLQEKAKSNTSFSGMKFSICAM